MPMTRQKPEHWSYDLGIAVLWLISIACVWFPNLKTTNGCMAFFLGFVGAGFAGLFNRMRGRK